MKICIALDCEFARPLVYYVVMKNACSVRIHR